MAELEVPSRHLGLIPAVEHGAAATAAVDAMTELVTAHVDLRAIVALAGGSVLGATWDPQVELAAAAEHATGGTSSAGDGSADDTRATDARSGVVSGRDPLIAMAGGPAFTFGYAEHRELLVAAGARVVVFDPLSDELPVGTAGLVLPGGFPEEHAGQLSANERLRTAVAEGAARGLPIHAECAGLLYLTRSLDGHQMAGVIDADAEFGPRLTLGYRDAVALHDSALWRAGARVRGHEFHRTRLARTGAENAAWGWRTMDSVAEGAVIRQVHASYLHTHPAGNPDAIARFVTAATRFDH